MLYQREFQNNEEPAKHHISCFGYETEADRQYPTHCHAYCEMSYLVSGERYQIINGQRYKVEPGSFFLFSPLCMHGYHNITECQDLVIQFSSDFLYQVSSSLQKDQVLEISPDAEPFLMLDGEHRKSLDDLYQKRFYNRICNKNGNLAEEWQMDAVILQFLAKLLENGSIQLHQGYGGKEEIQQISDVIHYLMANPAERLDMHEASRRCGLSYYAFSRFFHEMTGMGYAEYGNLIRIRHTEELLIYSDMSVEEISRAVGMSSANYYTRLFKKVNGMSPTKYRSVYGKRQY